MASIASTVLSTPDQAFTDNLSSVQRRRKQFAFGAGLLLLLAMLFTESLWVSESFVHEGLEIVGFGMILI